MDKDDVLLNVENAAKFLGISVSTIRRWARMKQVKGLKIGTRGDWRFTKKELVKMIKK